MITGRSIFTDVFVTVHHCSSLFVAVPNSSELFFSKFQCNFTFVEKVIKFYNFVYCRVRHRFFVFRTSCDRDDEKLSLKYIVERTRFYVSLKLEKKNSDELFGGKNYPIEIHGRANKLWPLHYAQNFCTKMITHRQVFESCAIVS